MPCGPMVLSWEQSSLNTFMNRLHTQALLAACSHLTTFGETCSPSFSKLLKALFLMFWNYLVFFILDLKILKKANAHLFCLICGGLCTIILCRNICIVGEFKQFRQAFESPYFYFALPFEPEYTVQSLCKEFADVNAIIRQTALSLPQDISLCQKEHQRIGNRSIEFYEKWRRFPNVIIANPALYGVSLIEKSEGTITWGINPNRSCTVWGPIDYFLCE